MKTLLLLSILSPLSFASTDLELDQIDLNQFDQDSKIYEEYESPQKKSFINEDLTEEIEKSFNEPEYFDDPFILKPSPSKERIVSGHMEKMEEELQILEL